MTADYWKSNDKKYCDFCKCWITDNKPSVAFHENGKRHKANVAKRISEISRNSAKAEKEKQKMDLDIRKMEDAAMRSYAHDVSSKADMTARSISVVMASNSSRKVAGIGGQVDPMLPPGDFDPENENGYARLARLPNVEVPEGSMWIEARSPEGHTYYWNVKTNESIWKAPKEGFMTLEEYNRINDIAVAQQELQLQEDSKSFQKSAPEIVAKYRREQLKVFRRQDEDAKVKEQKRETYKTEEDIQGAPPIGEWQPVIHAEEEQIDLGLPKVESTYIAPVISEFEPAPPVKKFKEKTITSLEHEVSAGTSTTFKKRKFPNRGNARQRLDVD